VEKCLHRELADDAFVFALRSSNFGDKSLNHPARTGKRSGAADLCFLRQALLRQRRIVAISTNGAGETPALLRSIDLQQTG